MRFRITTLIIGKATRIAIRAASPLSEVKAATTNVATATAVVDATRDRSAIMNLIARLRDQDAEVARDAAATLNVPPLTLNPRSLVTRFTTAAPTIVIVGLLPVLPSATSSPAPGCTSPTQLTARQRCSVLAIRFDASRHAAINPSAI